MSASAVGVHDVSVYMNCISHLPILPVKSYHSSTLPSSICTSEVVVSSPWGHPVSEVRFIPQNNKNARNTIFNSLVSNLGRVGGSVWRHYFNRFVRLHCERMPLLPIGLASIRAANGSHDDGDSTSRRVDDSGIQINCGESKKKVLILMSDTGGGHRASAEAIKAAFELEFGDEYKVFVTDLWKDHTPWPFNQIPRSYSFLVKHGTLWKVTFHGTAPRIIHQTNLAATSAFIAREVARGLMKYQPDIIVSVHPLMQHVPLRVLKSKGLLKKILFTTVITDLSTCHPTWFHKLVTRCYCPTPEVARRASKAGLQPPQIRVYGLPVRPSFCKAIRSKDELKRDLGMDEDLPAVLLMGGGEGMGPVEKTARALGETLYNEKLGEPIGQLIVICGRNRKLAKKLQSIQWNMPIQAGPGTIAEAMIRGLPIILNDYIAGQEAGNVPYVVENGAGRFCKSPKEIANIVAKWFGPKADELKMMSQNALKLARPDAVFKIVHDLDELVRQRDVLSEFALPLT
ncbi:probable monogalactosyldiacylglycerol synthase, chloroplastic isoform X2 [Cryptomeria japonica]|uniref:probable monogalactosyldiacylglycerol synthase, chloroplastic isoform X2 n=1 Tax=Cryptomeria japonica TaxID=3369 RepID=UPI0027DA1F78|nr:probable monogalactosyldiacylglycerol synthase, chloroplastic isoform X2 [Cryptomeria japonica]